MIVLPGFLIAILTFPGIIVHEAAHRFFCDIARVPVYEVCYFRINGPQGYVIHGPTDRLGAHFLISIGPLIVNSLLCAVLCFVPLVAFKLDVSQTPAVFIFLLWLGVSIGMHAFPSTQDVQSFSAAVKRGSGRSPLLLIAKLFQIVVVVANALRVIWFDLIYAVALAHVPLLLLAGTVQ